MTVVDQTGNVETLHHDFDNARDGNARIRKLSRRIARCNQRSRTWKRLQAVVQSVRRDLCNNRRHQRRSWANQLVRPHETLCIEKLSARNITGSARATNEDPSAGEAGEGCNETGKGRPATGSRGARR